MNEETTHYDTSILDIPLRSCSTLQDTSIKPRIIEVIVTNLLQKYYIPIAYTIILNKYLLTYYISLSNYRQILKYICNLELFII